MSGQGTEQISNINPDQTDSESTPGSTPGSTPESTSKPVNESKNEPRNEPINDSIRGLMGPNNSFKPNQYTLEMSKYDYPMAIFTSSQKTHMIKVEIDLEHKEIL